MRKVILALAAVASIGLIVPMTTPAHADKVVIKERGHHHRDYRHHHDKKVVVIKHRRYHHD